MKSLADLKKNLLTPHATLRRQTSDKSQFIELEEKAQISDQRS